MPKVYVLSQSDFDGCSDFDSIRIFEDQTQAREILTELGKDWLDRIEWDHMTQEEKDIAELEGEVELDTDYIYVYDMGKAQITEQEIIK